MAGRGEGENRMLLSSPLRRLLTAVVGLLILVAAACGEGNGLAAEDATLVNQYRVANGIPPLPRSYSSTSRHRRRPNGWPMRTPSSLHQPRGRREPRMAAHRRERGHGWFNQPGPISPASLRPHRENLLNWAYSEMGIGAVQKATASASPRSSSSADGRPPVRRGGADPLVACHPWLTLLRSRVCGSSGITWAVTTRRAHRERGDRPPRSRGGASPRSSTARSSSTNG